MKLKQGLKLFEEESLTHTLVRTVKGERRAWIAETLKVNLAL